MALANGDRERDSFRHREVNFYPIRNVLPTEIIMSKPMKRTILVLLLTPLFPSCETAHNAAVTTFHVIDAPAAYVRRKIDEEAADHDDDRSPGLFRHGRQPAFGVLSRPTAAADADPAPDYY